MGTSAISRPDVSSFIFPGSQFLLVEGGYSMLDCGGSFWTLGFCWAKFFFFFSITSFMPSLFPPFWVRHGGPDQNGQGPHLQTSGQNDPSVFGLSAQFRDCATTHPINAHSIGQKGGREAKVWTDTDSSLDFFRVVMVLGLQLLSPVARQASCVAVAGPH